MKIFSEIRENLAISESVRRVDNRHHEENSDAQHQNAEKRDENDGAANKRPLDNGPPQALPSATPAAGGRDLKEDIIESPSRSGVEDAGKRLPGYGSRDRDPVTGLPGAMAGGEAWRARMAEIRKALNESDRLQAETKAKKGGKASKSTDGLDPRTPEERSRREATQRLNKDTVRAIRDSGGTVDKFVSNLSPGGEDRNLYSELMLAGQQYLAEGRYFDAEERFIRAEKMRPEDFPPQDE